MTGIRPRLIRLLTLAGALAAGSSPAHAHLTNTGFGPFYDGLTHLFVTPEDLLPVVALSLLAGLRGPRCGRATLFALPAAWLVGILCSRLITAPTPSVATAAMTIALGALAAADRRLSLTVITGLAIGLGLVNGLFDGIGPPTGRSIGLIEAGGPMASFVIVAILAGSVASLRALWARAVVRVAASWIAASGLLMLGWAMRKA